MTGMKYIMYDRGGIETPILFPPTIEHDVMAERMNCMTRLISAGFVSLINEGQVEVAGRSTSLNLDSRREDKEIIENWLTWSL